MGLYKVIERMDRGKIYYLIRHAKEQHICILPTKYLKHKTDLNRSPNTVRNIAFSLVYYMEYLSFQDLKIEDLFQLSYLRQMEVFQGFLFWIRDRNHVDGTGKVLQNSTCNLYLRNVFGFYEFMELVEEQFGDLSVLTEKESYHTNAIGNRITKIHRSFEGYLKVYTNKGGSIDSISIIKLMIACTNNRDQLLLLLLAETGVRIGELLGINIAEDIDYKNFRIGVIFREDNENRARAKCEEYRWCRISKEAMQLLNLYLEEHCGLLTKSKYLFITLSGVNKGKALKKNAVDAMLKRLEAKTGIRCNTRMLRYYFVMERWSNGWGIEMISKALGHRRLETTMQYVNIDDNVLWTATDRLQKNRNGLINRLEMNRFLMEGNGKI